MDISGIVSRKTAVRGAVLDEDVVVVVPVHLKHPLHALVDEHVL